jgi:hypothetical protein
VGLAARGVEDRNDVEARRMIVDKTVARASRSGSGTRRRSANCNGRHSQLTAVLLRGPELRRLNHACATLGRQEQIKMVACPATIIRTYFGAHMRVVRYRWYRSPATTVIFDPAADAWRGPRLARVRIAARSSSSSISSWPSCETRRICRMNPRRITPPRPRRSVGSVQDTRPRGSISVQRRSTTAMMGHPG